ncbi:hypothetical protein H2204_006349 [Knufia peltigerae]|uniref:SnoaL-like domain-containing protein n=1 Tax=Knufia peltigerae TaxID=1002370 RepID=A0AA38Y3Q9_9EURO|nr:hypothetical protein H2204_006349 [Knufia peltigerae]
MADPDIAIRNLLTAYGTTLESGNVEDAVSLYTEDGVFMAPGYSPMSGTEELRAAYTRVFSTIRLKINFDIAEIVRAGEDWAFARSTAEGRKEFLKLGGDEYHNNQELFILRKVNGKWKIARYAFSSMKPIVL